MVGKALVDARTGPAADSPLSKASDRCWQARGSPGGLCRRADRLLRPATSAARAKTSTGRHGSRGHRAGAGTVASRVQHNAGQVGLLPAPGMGSVRGTRSAAATPAGASSMAAVSVGSAEVSAPWCTGARAGLHVHKKCGRAALLLCPREAYSVRCCHLCSTSSLRMGREGGLP